MAGICGIVHLDGKPVAPESLQRMAAAVHYRGPDGIRYRIHGHVGLVHLAHYTTPEAHREELPRYEQETALAMTADARVDNRTDLIRSLYGEDNPQDPPPTDADLLFSAYKTWKDQTPCHVIGDFSFAVWNCATQELFAARDPVGVRPFFYCTVNESFYFASAVSSLLAVLNGSVELNEPLLVDFLCWRFDRWVEETPYRNIFRLPAGHCIHLKKHRVRTWRYWRFGEKPLPPFRRLDDYAEHFLDLFAQAVQCRVRSRLPLGITVSGGLDSSSIACMAHHLGHSGADIRLYHIAFTKYPNADDRGFAEAVLARCSRFPCSMIDGDKIWGLKEFGKDGGFPLDEPEIYPIRSLLTEMFRAARKDGCAAVLTGEGGDLLLGSAAYAFPHFLLDLSCQTALRELKYFWKHSNWGIFSSLFRFCLGHLVKWLVPEGIRDEIRRCRQPYSFPPWVDRHCVSPGVFPPAPANLGQESSKRRYSLSAKRILAVICGGWHSALLSYLDRSAIWSGLEPRYPYLDRRIVDFMCRTPTEFRFSRGFDRLILRRSMAGILPDLVRMRMGKCVFTELADHGLRFKEKARVQLLLEAMKRRPPNCLLPAAVEEAYSAYFRTSSRPTPLLLAPLFLQSWIDCLL